MQERTWTGCHGRPHTKVRVRVLCFLHVQFSSFPLVSWYFSDNSYIRSSCSSLRDKVYDCIVFFCLSYLICLARTGEILHSTAKFDGELDGILKSGHVRCAAVDTSDIHLATSGDDKVLKVWNIDGLELLSLR